MPKILALVLLLPAFSWAGTESIYPQDTVEQGGTQWSLVPAVCITGTCYIDYVTDSDDLTYLASINSSSTPLMRMTDMVSIPGDATVDSFVVHVRARVNDAAGNDRIRPRIRSTNTSNFSDTGKGGTIANISLESSSFVDLSVGFNGFPVAGGDGSGILSIARMDSLEIQWIDVLGDTNCIAECSVVVWYTEAGGVETPKRRRKLLQIGAKEESPVEYANTVWGLPPKENLVRER